MIACFWVSKDLRHKTPLVQLDERHLSVWNHDQYLSQLISRFSHSLA